MRPLHQTAARHKPVLYQTWEKLAFIHWSCEPDEIAAKIPMHLTLDTFDNRAWVGIVPFFMRRIRPRYLPALPWLSATPELNLRTYVRDAEGNAGVWFFSLNASNPVAVWAARTFFHLPYYRARIVARESAGMVDYYCRRRGASEDKASRFCYRGIGPGSPAGEGTLNYFLVERYRLFAQHRKTGRLFSARVVHEPYRLQKAELSRWDVNLFALDSLIQPDRPPDHVCYASSVEVAVMPLRPLATPAGD